MVSRPWARNTQEETLRLKFAKHLFTQSNINLAEPVAAERMVLAVVVFFSGKHLLDY